MKDSNYIDDLFRSGLEGFEMKPSEKSWNSLDEAISKKKASQKRRKRFMFFSITLLLILTSLITYKKYTTNNSSTIENKSESKTSSNTFIDLQTKKNSPSKPLTKYPEEITAAKINKKVLVSSNLKSVENKKVADEMINNTVNRDNNSILTNNSFAKTKQTSINASSLSPILTSSGIPQKTTTSSVNNEINHSVNNNLSEKNDNKSSLNDSEQNPVDDKINNTPIENKIISANYLVNIENKPLETKNNFTSEKLSTLFEPENKDLKNEPASDNETGKPSTAVSTDYTQEQKSDSSISPIKKIVSHISFEIFYSPYYVKNRIKVNESYTGSASQNLSDYENQKAAFSYSTGINVRYDIGKKWSISSGISYSTFAQNAVYNTINVVVDSVYQKVYGHQRGPRRGGGNGGPRGNMHNGQNPHRPPGNGNHHFVIQTPCGVIDLYKEPPHQNRGNHRNGDTLNIKTETSESIQYINVPLTVRHRFGQHKFSYFVEGGAAISFVKGDNVKITIDDAYTENNERDGLRNTNYSILIGAGVNYNFYKGLKNIDKKDGEFIEKYVRGFTQDEAVLSKINWIYKK